MPKTNISKAIENPDEPMPVQAIYAKQKGRVRKKIRLPLEKPKKKLKMTTNQVAFLALRATGLSDYQISKKLGLSSGYANQVIKKGEKERKDNYLAYLEALTPASLRSLKKLTQGKKVGDMESVKGSDVLGAIKENLDRIIPKSPETSTPINTFIQINHNLFAPAESVPTPINITT